MTIIAQLAEEFNVAIVITNHVISDPGGGAMFVSDPKKPIGGAYGVCYCRRTCERQARCFTRCHHNPLTSITLFC